MASLSDDETVDVVTGLVVTLRGNEKIRQQVARFLSVEYGIPVDDMARDLPIPVTGGVVRRSVKKADLAVVASGEPHTPANLQRVVICKSEPKGGRAVTELRTHEQAREVDDDLPEIARACRRFRVRHPEPGTRP